MADPKPGWHVLTSIDPEARTAVCAICGPVGVVYKAHRNQYRCRTVYNAQRQAQKRRRREALPPRPPGKWRSPGRIERDRLREGYREHKGSSCQRCGFVPEHPCQLDVDHVVPRSLGGTDDVSNLQTLCSNCHRLKSYEEREAYAAMWREGRCPAP